MRIAFALIAALVCASASAAGPRNMNVGGQGGHLNVPLSGVVLRLPLTVSTADECSGAAIPGVTFSRSSSATCTKSDGTVVTLSANQPRVTAAGLLIEGAATNYFLNSGSPATQTITLSTTGTYTGWTDAGETGGSMSLAVGTATATGLPCSTSSGSCTFTITVAGTITATVSGTPAWAQVESSAIRTSRIPTAGTSAARTADVASVATPVALSTSEGCTKVCVTPGWTGANPSSGSIYFLNANSSLTSRFLYMNPSSTAVTTFDGTHTLGLSAALASGTKSCFVTRWSAGQNKLRIDNLTAGTSSSDSAFSAFPSYGTSIDLGSGAGSNQPISASLSGVQFGRAFGACQ